MLTQEIPPRGFTSGTAGEFFPGKNPSIPNQENVNVNPEGAEIAAKHPDFSLIQYTVWQQ